jgi:hypothetical protein
MVNEETLLKAVWLFSWSIILFASAGCNEEAERWTVWVADGKNDLKQLELITAKSPLDNYKENMALIHPWDFGRVYDSNDWTQIKLGTPEITCIGEWGEYIVYDLTDRENVCKQIMLKDKSGNYRIIYSQLPWCTAGVEDLPYIITIQEIPVLVYRTRVPGNGNQFLEYYFVYDNNKRKPFRIDTSEIQVSLSRILPEGCSVWWDGGGLNIEKMIYSTAVWKEGDGHSRPTGGRVDLKLRLENGKIVIVEEKYDSQYDWDLQ